MKNLFFIVGIFLSTIIFGETPKKLTPISFATMWVPQAQFAGYYMAQEKGFYKELGLDVALIHSTPEKLAPQMLSSEEVDIGILWLSEALELNDAGLKFINIGQIVQKSATMLIGKKSQGINNLSDINGKNVGIWSGSLSLQAREFVKKFGLQANFITQSYYIHSFLKDAVDITSAMWYNEYYMILNAGYDPDELTSFFFKDYDLNFPEDALYVNKTYLEENPESVRKFVLASLKGWIYAFQNSDETIEVVLNKMKAEHLPANEPHQKWMLDRMYDIIIGDSYKSFGKLEQSDFKRVQSIMLNNQLIKTEIDFNKFYQPQV